MILFGVHYSFIRGMQSEDNVEQALKELKRDKKILAYHRAARNSKLDHRGIDFIATKLDGDDVFIQVKSSDSAVEKWNRKRGRPKAINGQNPNVIQLVKKILFGRILEHFHGMTNKIDNGWTA